ncbi:MAG: hypothetical protein GVY13_00095 [Alphaproteobacteria bacterium]|jgi:hypothetical protein|nr:hypothetical protein [Alphaproteobacteria bacterium]
MIDKVETKSLELVNSDSWDLFIGTWGDEPRSRELIHRLDFTKTGWIIYLHENVKDGLEFPGLIFGDSPGIIITGGSLYKDSQFQYLEAFVCEKPIRVLVDISCMSRTMICELTYLMLQKYKDKFRSTFCYLPAQFSRPHREYPKVRSVGPAFGPYAGFDFNPGDPLALILGIGFEYGLALGMINRLEPKKTIALWGSGHLKEFDSEVKKANFDFDFSPYQVAVLEYKLNDPLSAFIRMDNIVSNLVPEYRVILAPMGPKIFALLCALLAEKHFGKVAVYKVDYSHSIPSYSAAGYTILIRIGHSTTE